MAISDVTLEPRLRTLVMDDINQGDGQAPGVPDATADGAALVGPTSAAAEGPPGLLPFPLHPDSATGLLTQ